MESRKLTSHIILILLGAITFFPFVFMIITAFKSVPQFYHNFWGISLPLHWENFFEAWRSMRRYILNSMLVSGVTLFGVLTLGSISAYVFARFDFKGRDVLYFAMLSLLMVPGVLTLVPSFMVVKQLGLLNSYWVLILPYISGGQVFATFLLRSFFETIPKDLFDAATIDGTSEPRILRHIVLPLSKPILGVVAIMNLLATWNEFMWPYVTLNDAGKFNLPIGLLTFGSQYGFEYGLRFAGYLIASAPLLLLFTFATKTFMKGMSSGAVKF
ncbi:carbohydrate ABC transporter permease [candidate division KSB1 bacterium]|nr:carbohydrate ABC transporter permease [candidate division KSB1 bacterium]